MIPADVYARNVDLESCDMYGYLGCLRSEARGRVLEIGVRQGVSTSALLLGIKEHGGHLYSVDVDNCGHLFNDENWTFIHADSSDSKKVISVTGQEPFDMLLIDGDHTREGYARDLHNYANRVREGGLIFSHDIRMPDVADEFRNFAAPRGLASYEIPNGWAGMGVMIWRKNKNEGRPQSYELWFSDRHPA